MRDLEEVDVLEAPVDEHRVDVLLHVAGQEEAAPLDLAEEHDRLVVDLLSRVADAEWQGGCVGPQHPNGDRVEAQPIPRAEATQRRLAGGEHGIPGVPTRA